MDYLDEIIAMDEKTVTAQENEAPKPESPKRNYESEPPKEEEKSQILDPKVQKFLEKPVVKKKVKFSTEDDVTEAPDYEDNLTRIYSTNASSKSGVNQFQDMLEAQVKKEQLLKERELQAAVEREELEVGSDGDQGDPEDDGTYDSEYDDEIFQPDDLDTVKRDIQEYMQDQSSFQKVQLVCLKLTNHSFRQYIQNKGKSIED